MLLFYYHLLTENSLHFQYFTAQDRNMRNIEELYREFSILKLDFFCDAFKDLDCDDDSKSSLILAVVLFDRDLDEECFYKEFSKHSENEDKIVLESFFNFKLLHVKKRWQELANVINSNFENIVESDTFLEFISFLTEQARKE